MRYFIDDKEVDINTLKQVHNNLQCCSNDGGEYEELVVDDIIEDEMHFSIVVQSTF